MSLGLTNGLLGLLVKICEKSLGADTNISKVAGALQNLVKHHKY